MAAQLDVIVICLGNVQQNGWLKPKSGQKLCLCGGVTSLRPVTFSQTILLSVGGRKRGLDRSFFPGRGMDSKLSVSQTQRQRRNENDSIFEHGVQTRDKVGGQECRKMQYMEFGRITKNVFVSARSGYCLKSVGWHIFVVDQVPCSPSKLCSSFIIEWQVVG